MTEERDRRKRMKKQRIQLYAMCIGLSIAVVLGTSYVYFTIEIPTQTQVYIEYHNGTKKWILEEEVENQIDLIKPNYEDSMRKVINLNDGTIDYRFKHVDAIGAKPKLP